MALADDLAGAFGHGVDRPALNAFVANSQATNGLRTAQTDEALNNAQLQQEELRAHSDLENSLSSVVGDDGKPLLQPSAAHLVANELKGHYGDAKSVMEAFREAQSSHNTAALSNVNNLADPNAPGAALTAAQQGLSGKVAEPVAVSPNFTTLPGTAPVTVQQTPLGAAQTKATTALGNLNTVKADAGGFAPHASAAGAISPDQQQKLQTLLGAGYIGPSQMYSFSKNPSLIDAAFGAFNNDPTGSIGVAQAKQHTLTSFASGQSQKGLLAGNTVIAHMGLIPQAVDALKNGDVTFLNRTFNGLNAATGTPAPVLAQQLSEFLGRETVNAVQANGGGQAEREAASHIFDNAQAPQTLLDAANQAKQLLGGRLHGAEQDFVGTMSMGQPGSEEQYRQNFRSRFLTPETRRAVGMTLPNEDTAGFGPNAVLPDYKTEQDAIDAGHKPGERVSIGGVPGTLR